MAKDQGGYRWCILPTYDDMVPLLLESYGRCEPGNACAHDHERQATKRQVRLRWSSRVVAHRAEESREAAADEPEEAPECVEGERHLDACAVVVITPRSDGQ